MGATVSDFYEVRVTDELDEWVRKAIDAVAPSILPRLEKEARDIVAHARERWPIGRERYGGEDGPKGRPHSRDLFEIRTKIGGRHSLGESEISVAIYNDAPYFFKIKSGGRRTGEFEWEVIKGKSPFEELIRKPTIARVEALADELSEDLARLGGD